MSAFNNLEYKKDTGELLWKENKRGIKKGQAGSLRKDGYKVVRIDRKLYLVHRVAYFLETGIWPEFFLDHINGNKSDNRWENLRCATPSENNCNRPLSTKGVYEKTRKGRKGIWYDVRIQKDGKQYGSYFRNKEDAIRWREQKEIELFGEFRREI